MRYIGNRYEDEKIVKFMKKVMVKFLLIGSEEIWKIVEGKTKR
ncbi:MAG: hypothetical protein ACP5OB_07465 [Candidatus Ratteibacteria bacterium]